MSTILKALKKLEEEQRAAAPVSLADKVLTASTHERRATRKLPWVAAGVLGGLLVAALAATGIYWLSAPTPLPGPVARTTQPPAGVTPDAVGLPQSAAVKTPAPPTEKVPKPTAPPITIKSRSVAATRAVPPAPSHPAAVVRANNQKVNGAPAPAIEVATPVARPPTRPAAPPPQPVVAATPAPQASPPSLPDVPAASPPARVVPATVLRGRGEQVVVTPAQIPPAGRQWTAPHLEVTDILGGGGSGGRMAVVNGLPVMEGTRVDNALVKEIRADQVIFEIDGRSVAVPRLATH